MASPKKPFGPRRFREVALASGLLTVDQLNEAGAELARERNPSSVTPEDLDKLLAEICVNKGWITSFQAREMLNDRHLFRLGQYTVLDEIGKGGMGQVFRAEHAMMGREVAVKVLPRAKSTPESEAAFRREMRMLGRLDHENLVRAFDAGYDAMVYYLVTELVPGNTELHLPLLLRFSVCPARSTWVKSMFRVKSSMCFVCVCSGLKWKQLLRVAAL
jgi:serine/threonine protein kinase